MLGVGQGNPERSFRVPYSSSTPDMNGMTPQARGHSMKGRRYSAGPTLSALHESSNEHNLSTADVSNNCSDMSTGSSTGNVISGMIGARSNPAISSGPRYSLDMLIAALGCPTETKDETHCQKETDFAPCTPSQQQFDTVARFGNEQHKQESQVQDEHWEPQSVAFRSSSDVWQPWTPSSVYSTNPGQGFAQRMDWGMGYQGTMGYHDNADFAQAQVFLGQPSNASSLSSSQSSTNSNNSNEHGSARTKQEKDVTFDASRGFEMVDLNWMQQGRLGEHDVTRLDASAIQSPPSSAFYSQQTNSAQSLQNQMRQQQMRQYASGQPKYGQQTPPTTMLRTPPPSGGRQSYVHEANSVKLGLSRKRSVPNDESHLPLDINNGSSTLSPTEEDMMMRKRSKSFDVAMILSNPGGMRYRSSGHFLEASAFRDRSTQAYPRYPGQLKFDDPNETHGRAFTSSLITDSSHSMSANLPSSASRNGHAPHLMMFDSAQMKNPPPAQCRENIPSVPDSDTSMEEGDNLESRPRRQNVRYSGDLYTPQWVRYLGQAKEGFCDTCSPGKWLQLKNSAYWYHKQFFHGISSVSGQTFLNPLEQRVVEQDAVEGLCHQCNQWIPISNSRRKNCVLWYRHAHKCHIYQKPKSAIGMKKQF